MISSSLLTDSARSQVPTVVNLTEAFAPRVIGVATLPSFAVTKSVTLVQVVSPGRLISKETDSPAIGVLSLSVN